jgi:hypothetical protein
MEFCNMNDILYDKWNKILDYLQKLNIKQKITLPVKSEHKTKIQTHTLTHQEHDKEL